MSVLRQQAHDYHALPTTRKISDSLTTAAETSEDLSLAYSLGVIFT
jgi:malate dehydrogenase (oxaloacetate-decarboxylating)(NADP+)